MIFWQSSVDQHEGYVRASAINMVYKDSDGATFFVMSDGEPQHFDHVSLEQFRERIKTANIQERRAI